MLFFKITISFYTDVGNTLFPISIKKIPSLSWVYYIYAMAIISKNSICSTIKKKLKYGLSLFKNPNIIHNILQWIYKAWLFLQT